MEHTVKRRLDMIIDDTVRSSHILLRHMDLTCLSCITNICHKCTTLGVKGGSHSESADGPLFLLLGSSQFTPIRTQFYMPFMLVRPIIVTVSSSLFWKRILAATVASLN
jgi:hypothetical protein